MYSVLIVDDDKIAVEGVQAYLEARGYSVFCAYDAAGALDFIASTALDAILLDVMLPDGNGLELCEQLSRRRSVPILFLSVLGAENDRIKGFLAGADDYIVKPFSLPELELRIRRRIESKTEKGDHQIYRFGGLEVDTGRRLVSYGGVSTDFTTLEFDLLALLVSHPERVFSYQQLYDLVWQAPIMRSRHNIQVCVARVRQKLNGLCRADYIRTVSGKGYKFMPNAGRETAKER